MADAPAALIDTRAAAPRAHTPGHPSHSPLDSGRMIGRQTAAAQRRKSPYTRNMEPALAAFADNYLADPER